MGQSKSNHNFQNIVSNQIKCVTIKVFSNQIRLKLPVKQAFSKFCKTKSELPKIWSIKANQITVAKHFVK